MSALQAWLHPRRAAATIREQRKHTRLLLRTLAIALGTAQPGYDNVVPLRRNPAAGR